MSDLHTPRQPPHHGGSFISGEVLPRFRAQQAENAPDGILAAGLDRVRIDLRLYTNEFAELLGEAFGGKHKIRAAGDGVARHRVELGFGRLLNKNQTAGLANGPGPQGAIGTAAAQYDGVRIRLMDGKGP